MIRTFIIVDDDVAFTSLLKKKLSHFPDLDCVDTYHDTISAAKGITKHKPDILFLDMEIDSLNGLDVLEVLDHKPKTIVISSSSEYEASALDLKVYDYVKKPISSLERLKEAIDKVM